MFIALALKSAVRTSRPFQLDPSVAMAAIAGIALLVTFGWVKRRYDRRKVALRCPRCGNHHVRRSRTRGWGEQVMKAVWFLPFRCRDCERRFWAFLKE